MTLDECISEIKTQHFPNPPASRSVIESLESTLHWPIPPELRSFFLACNGARLFDDTGSPFEFLPIEAFHATSIDVFGEIREELAPTTWYSVAHVQDGKYIAIDLTTVDGDTADYLDAFHETFGQDGYQMVIARSFSELLSDALKSGGEHYWLHDDFAGYGHR